MKRLPFFVVKGASAICLASLPLLMLGALVSSMDTTERYFVQLAVVLLLAGVSVVASVGAIRKYTWGKHLLMVLYAASSAFWVSVGVDLNSAGGGYGTIPLGVGVFCLAVMVALAAAESK